jgi:hypothetical protein
VVWVFVVLALALRLLQCHSRQRFSWAAEFVGSNDAQMGQTYRYSHKDQYRLKGFLDEQVMIKMAKEGSKVARWGKAAR